MFAHRAYTLLLTARGLIFAYLTHRVLRRGAVYMTLAADVALHPETIAEALAALMALEATLAPEGSRAVDPTNDMSASRGAGSDMLGRLIVDAIVTYFATLVEAALVRDADMFLRLLAFDLDPTLLVPIASTVDAEVLLPTVYVLVYVLPRSNPTQFETALAAGMADSAKSIWVQWREEGGAGGRGAVIAAVMRQLGILICRTDICVTCDLSFIFSSPPSV
jgi:hypothetical protein